MGNARQSDLRTKRILRGTDRGLEVLYDTHGCFGSVGAAGSECVFGIEVLFGDNT